MKAKKEFSSMQSIGFSLGYGEYHILKEFFDHIYNEVEEDATFFIKNMKMINGISEVSYVTQCPPDPLNMCICLDALFDDTPFMINIYSYIDQRGIKHIDMSLKSKFSTYYDLNWVKKTILEKAISSSGLRGSNIEFLGALKDGWKELDAQVRTFDDIFVPEEIMKDIRLYKDYFDKTGYLMTYLFSGPPGTGKTEANIALSYLLNQEGVTVIKTGISEDLKAKIDIAELLSPSLVVIDDIDLYLGNRKSGISKPLLQTFLDTLDGFEKMSNKVGIIATTNSTHLLDLAAQRPGRFDRVLIMDKLDKENIKGIILKALNYEFEKKNNSKEAKTLTDQKIIDKIAEYGFTGARVYNAVKAYMRRFITGTAEEKSVSTEGFISLIENEKETVDKIEGKGGFAGSDQLTSYVETEDRQSGGDIGFTNPSK